jgi:transcriptional regulator with PAS, ATPase and Fis domain
MSLADTTAAYEHHLEDKKVLKREANRRSAQLSRKRKKQFTEELKEENDELRKKELILKSIPDLVVVFDSTGRLWFVSESVSRFLKFTASELEGTSVWDRLCEDSTRLLKAAFMDSLAARQAGSDTAPLGTGLWELRLVDKDGTQKVITLNGVVHFAGDRPECVCSIRPSQVSQPNNKKSSSKSAEDIKDNHYTSLISVQPHQSVVSSGGSDTSSSHRKSKRVNHGKGREAMRISDSGNSSGESETASGSGSSDD